MLKERFPIYPETRSNPHPHQWFSGSVVLWLGFPFTFEPGEPGSNVRPCYQPHQ